MKLQNLKELIVKFQDEVSKLEFKDILLPKDFQDEYASFVADSHPSGFESIKWAEHNAHITTAKQNIFASNIWFLIASKLASFIQDLENHKSVFLDIFGDRDTEEIAKKLKVSIDEYEAEIAAYFEKNGRTTEERNNFIQFVSDYGEWGGGKTVDRGDYFVSAVLKGANLVAASHGAVAEFAYQLFSNPGLWEKLSGQIDAINSKKSLIPLGVNQLPKPFLLLAGISGTGKTRFVREQAAASRRNVAVDNYRLIPVRPDWHEPSDLLGYVSRIGANGSARYVVTDLLKFVVQAWQNAAALAFASATALPCKSPDEMTPFWLCLDEMNLAPVEQYFADYLSVVETRKWEGGNYSCDPLLKAATITQLDAAGRQALRAELALGDAQFDGLWAYFLESGIPLPPNLIVAGTVNMDETTHGFSRKVIDRAFTIDFGVFYPNDFAEFFEEDKLTAPKTLGFPLLSGASKAALAGVIADAGGAKSIAFMGAINEVLKGSPFELAYRALNELLLAVVCFRPKDDAELQAVWDDFLMSKVLPRIDGDAEKLSADGESSLLTRLLAEIEKQFAHIGSAQRPDLLREKIGGGVCMVDCRSKQKLAWMQERLRRNGFTTFWP